MRRLLVFLVACGGGSSGDDQPDASVTGDGNSAFALPPLNGGLDYQLGGAYAPPAGVTIVSRDRTASPAAGLYNICYVNGFQIQESEASDWMTQHADLILRDTGGNPVIDTDCNEMRRLRRSRDPHRVRARRLHERLRRLPRPLDVLRDRNLVTPGTAAYVYDGC